MTQASLTTRLIEAADSVLVVIDMQDSFFDKYDSAVSQRAIGRAAWLLQVAGQIGVPVVAMAEDIARLGPLTPRIQQALPDGTQVHDKNVFGCGDQPAILQAIRATGRGTAILVGVETDVCVCHSALSLMQNGFDVAVVEDATATTAGDQGTGLARIRGAGAVICSSKSLFYEWMRSVSGCAALADQAPALQDAALPEALQL